MTNACISTVTVKNKTDNKITRGGNATANDGHYESLPPIDIAANGEATFKMKANAGLAGSDGSVVYFVPYGASASPPLVYQARVTIKWNCPYIGLNSVTVESDTSSVTVTKSTYDSSGDLTFTAEITRK